MTGRAKEKVEDRAGQGAGGVQATAGIALTEEELQRLRDGSRPLLCWYDREKRDLPWRRDVTPYRVWLSEIMLQQTRVEAGKDYFLRFVSALPDIQSLANVSDELLMKLWEGLGYYNRARNLKKAAGVVVEQYGGQLPDTYEKLLELPGIGPYTAGAISSIAFQQPQPAVDGNVLRVVMRLLGRYDDIARDSVKKAVEEGLRQVMSEGAPCERPGDFNQSLMELGATVCIPNGQPRCGDCPWGDICRARALDIAAELPVKQPKKQRRVEERTVLLLWDEEGRLLLHRRDDKGLLAGLWELPSVSGRLTADQVEELLRQGGMQVLESDETFSEGGLLDGGTVMPAGEAVHVFSHVEWRMTGYEATVRPGPAHEISSWQEPEAQAFAAELPPPYLRDVKREPPRWVFARRDQIRSSIALPSAFKGFRGRILGR